VVSSVLVLTSGSIVVVVVVVVAVVVFYHHDFFHTSFHVLVLGHHQSEIQILILSENEKNLVFSSVIVNGKCCGVWGA
jgi:hypothetical protein